MILGMNTAPDSPNAIAMPPITGVTEDRAAALLGTGVPASTVAASLGISNARISQLLSDEAFAARVAELRYNNLAKHNERDGKADSIEDMLLEKIEESIPLVHRPMELTKMYQVLNGAKRRGTSTPEAMIEKQSIVQLVVPIQIINKFQANTQGQVVTVGEQNLLTIQSGSLDGLAKEMKMKYEKENGNGSATIESGSITADSI